MGRTYIHCFKCHKRMRKFKEDLEGDRAFYFCRGCGRLWTYMPRRNATTELWPKDVFNEAVADGVVTGEGEILV